MLPKSDNISTYVLFPLSPYFQMNLITAIWCRFCCFLCGIDIFTQKSKTVYIDVRQTVMYSLQV